MLRNMTVALVVVSMIANLAHAGKSKGDRRNKLDGGSRNGDNTLDSSIPPPPTGDNTQPPPPTGDGRRSGTDDGRRPRPPSPEPPAPIDPAEMGYFTSRDYQRQSAS